MTTTTGKRTKASASLDQEQSSSSVVNLVANVAAVIAFSKRTLRSVQDVYNEPGEVYLRRAHRMKFNTFQRLANVLRPHSIAPC